MASSDDRPAAPTSDQTDQASSATGPDRRLPLLQPPGLRLTLGSLLRADFLTQGRNVRALLASMILPIVYLVVLSTGKRAAALGAPSFRVASCMVAGMSLIAILGYSLTLARDRELGVFQRLRVAPIPTWEIMVSRLIVQVTAMLGMAVIVLVAAVIGVSLRLSAGGYALTLVIIVVSAAEFLGIGQVIVGLIRSSETVRAVAGLIFAPLFVLSIFSHLNVLGSTFEIVSRWSPGGVVATILAGAMQPSTWGLGTWGALLASIGYAVLFVGLGIRWFRWTAR